MQQDSAGRRGAAWQLASGDAVLESFLGRPLLLLFWNVGCSGCTGRALPLTLTLGAEYPDLAIVAIHSVFGRGQTQPSDTIRAVVDYFALPYPVLEDDGDRTFQAYGAEGTPHWILIRGDGTVDRSIFGSMDGARQRLRYALQELFPAAAPPT